jgi:hypothetical protein
MKNNTLGKIFLAIVIMSVIFICQASAQKGKIPERIPVISNCLKGVCNPQWTEGLKAPAPKGEYELIKIKGPGTFISGEIVKQGGNNDITFISLEIDGKVVISTSIAGLKNWGLTNQNSYGLVLLTSAIGIKTVTIGFPFPLNFKSELLLKVHVNEDNVEQIVANVIYGS